MRFEHVDAVFTLALAAYNLIRVPKLLAVRPRVCGQTVARIN